MTCLQLSSQSLGENKTLNQQNHWETLGCTRNQNECMLVFIDGVHLWPYLWGLSALTGWCQVLSEGGEGVSAAQGVAPRLTTWQRVSIQTWTCLLVLVSGFEFCTPDWCDWVSVWISWLFQCSRLFVHLAFHVLFEVFLHTLCFCAQPCCSWPSPVSSLQSVLCMFSIFRPVSSALCQNFSLFRWSRALFVCDILFPLVLCWWIFVFVSSSHTFVWHHGGGSKSLGSFTNLLKSLSEI